MANEKIVQYCGFQTKRLVREYTFSVREAGVPREYTLHIANEAFLSHRASYQDGPGICALRLNVELAAHSNHPPESHFAITASELDSYRDSHTRRPAGSPHRRKPPNDAD